MNVAKKIRTLIVDDDAQLRKVLKIVLHALNHEVIEALNGKEAVEAASTENPDIIVLDLSLPDMESVDVISNIREWSKVPILVLSGEAEENDKLESLEKKADDFIVKPFQIDEFLERIKACLKYSSREAEEEPNVIKVGNLKVDVKNKHVTLDGNVITLTNKQYDLLKILSSHAGKVLTNKQLIRAISSETQQEDYFYLNNYIDQLRQKIEPTSESSVRVILEPNIGYRLVTAE